MFSGGLDSILSVKLIRSQEIKVTAFHFLLPFTYLEKEKPIKALETARRLGIDAHVYQAGEEYVNMLKNPEHGYGKNMNPCIDCRIFMLKKAGEFMRETGASFLFSGEVVGQRPMTQRKKVMQMIERKAKVKDLLLRPLSAKLLKPTIPEGKGWIERKKLLGLQGRSRKTQINLAREFGIKDYPSPAGGCCLTDPQFAIKLKDALEYNEVNISELRSLRFGRHFRLNSGAKLIVGRNEEENYIIEDLAEDKDLLIEGIGFGSPIALLKKSHTPEDIEIASSICLRYTKKSEDESAKVSVRTKEVKLGEKEVSPMEKEAVESLLIY